MNILSFDTTTDYLTICINTQNRIYEYNIKEGLKHSEKLLPKIELLMNEASLKNGDIDLIVCSKGPGSFTGLRIGMSTAKGLSFGWDCPVVSVPSLDSYAYGYDFFNGYVLPVIDAKKGNVFTAEYKNGKRISDYLDIKPEDLVNRIKDYASVLITGPNSDILTDLCIKHSNIRINSKLNKTNAFILGILGLNLYKTNGPDKNNEGPLYLRKSEAEINMNI